MNYVKSVFMKFVVLIVQLTLSLGSFSQSSISSYEWVPKAKIGSYSAWCLLASNVDPMNCGHDHHLLRGVDSIDFTIHFNCLQPNFNFLIQDKDSNKLTNLNNVKLFIEKPDGAVVLTPPIFDGSIWSIDLSQFVGEDISIQMVFFSPESYIDNTILYE